MQRPDTLRCQPVPGFGLEVEVNWVGLGCHLIGIGINALVQRRSHRNRPFKEVKLVAQSIDNLKLNRFKPGAGVVAVKRKVVKPDGYRVAVELEDQNCSAAHCGGHWHGRRGNWCWAGRRLGSRGHAVATVILFGEHRRLKRERLIRSDVVTKEERQPILLPAEWTEMH